MNGWLRFGFGLNSFAHFVSALLAIYMIFKSNFLESGAVMKAGAFLVTGIMKFVADGIIYRKHDKHYLNDKIIFWPFLLDFAAFAGYWMVDMVRPWTKSASKDVTLQP